MGLDWKGILDFYEEAELDNWGLRRGKMMCDRYRFVVEGQVYLGELSSLTSLSPRECIGFRSPEWCSMFLTLFVSKCVKLFWPMLSLKAPRVTTATIFSSISRGVDLFVLHEFQTFVNEQTGCERSGIWF